MRSANEIRQYHIISISKTSLAAQKFNVKNEPDKFWERLPAGRWMCSVWYSSEMRDFEVFKSIYRLLVDLDAKGLKYETDKPMDFLKKHIILTGEGGVALCNQHLIKAQRSPNPNRPKKSNASATTTTTTTAFNNNTITSTQQSPSMSVSAISTRPRYTSHANLTRFIKTMFPQSTSNQIANSTPEWALEILRELASLTPTFNHNNHSNTFNVSINAQARSGISTQTHR